MGNENENILVISTRPLTDLEEYLKNVAEGVPLLMSIIGLTRHSLSIKSKVSPTTFDKLIKELTIPETSFQRIVTTFTKLAPGNPIYEKLAVEAFKLVFKVDKVDVDLVMLRYREAKGISAGTFYQSNRWGYLLTCKGVRYSEYPALDEYTIQVGDRLIKLLKGTGTPYSKFSEITGVAYTQLNRMSNGKAVSADVLITIASKRREILGKVPNICEYMLDEVFNMQILGVEPLKFHLSELDYTLY